MKELKDSEIKTSPPKKPLIFYYLAALIVLMLLNVFLFPSLLERQVVEVPYSQFLTMVDGGQVEQVALDETSREIVFIAKDDGGREGYYKTGVWPDDGQRLLAQLQAEEGITFTAEIPTQANPILSFLVSWILPIVIFIVIGELLSRWMMKRMGGLPGGMGNAMTFGKSGAKVYVEEASTGVSFADVAGQDEAKESLMEVVDFLHGPEKYAAIGAHLPKGVLLVGPPGTGKTLLAKAVAGEAKVPFFSISGSEFVEMFVGMGAAKVRDLFKQAGEKAPCIVFIDEIDAIGKKRDTGGLGGNDEREQTLNQLLAEMDGFDANDGVIVMAATNRADILDKALLRPGRFDRQVYVGLPDVKGREEILRVHTKNKPLGPDVSLKTIARSTAGFSGADLENLVNEAALLAARQGKKAITEKEIEEASVKVMMGPEKKSHVVTDEERRLTAYHETGHAITGYFSKHHDPVHQISIISRGGAGGYTMYLPEKDPSYVTKTAMFENIVTSLGGRVAEQLVLEDISTGASSDLEQATKTARAMVTRYGFSERLGPVVYGGDPGETFLGRDFGQGKGYSEAIASEIDNEIRDIVDEAYETARRILTEHMAELHKVSAVLMEREKISGEEFKTLMEGGTLPPYDLANGKTAEPAAPAVQAEQPKSDTDAEQVTDQPDVQQ